MKEYIERKSLQDEIRSLSVSITGILCGKGVLNEYMKQYRESVLRIVDEQPTADVQEVKRGRWAHLGADEWCCTCCGFVITTEGSREKPEEKYCSNCGAKMDGGESE